MTPPPHAEALGRVDASASPAPLLCAEDVVVDFAAPRRRTLRALDRVSLDIGRSESVGLVGASGSGKSTLGKAILGLVPVKEGRISFDGDDLTRLGAAARRELASSLQVVFQDPYGSLDPTMTIGRILAEPLSVTRATKRDIDAAVRDMLDRVHLPASSLNRYPSEFSGGQRQRVAIARALVRRPRLVICDEPVSALDLTTQATIIDLLVDLQRDTGVSYLFVSHDLNVVRRVCHRVFVMRHGKVVESGEGDLITRSPQHHYTRELLLAAPVADPRRQASRRAEWLRLRSGEPRLE